MAKVRESTEPVFSRDELRQLYATAGLIPAEWTDNEEEVIATDEESVKERLLDNPKIRSACEDYPHQPIIRYIWDGLQGRESVLWQRGEDALKRRTWALNRYVYRGDKVLIEPVIIERMVE
jgi:hypothetical protein